MIYNCKTVRVHCKKRSAPEMSETDNFLSDPPSLPIRLKCPPGPKNEHFFTDKKKPARLDSGKPKYRRYNWGLPRSLFFLCTYLLFLLWARCQWTAHDFFYCREARLLPAERLVFTTPSSLNFVCLFVCLSVCLSLCLSAQMKSLPKWNYKSIT